MPFEFSQKTFFGKKFIDVAERTKFLKFDIIFLNLESVVIRYKTFCLQANMHPVDKFILSQKN